MSRILLGAHMSVAGGYYKALQRGHSIGCTALQIFTKSNRQWHAPEITMQESLQFQEMQKKLALHVIAHASYLINIGSDNKAVEEKSTQELIRELERCDKLAIHYLVLHPGSGTPRQECIEKIITNLDKVFTRYQGPTMILLENMAGQGNTVGNSLEELAFIRKSVEQSTKIGFCFDTCHAFAAGYDFTNEISYSAFWKYYDELIGRQHLKAIHLNDSKKEHGSRVDRHENIGQGKLGTTAFKLLMNDPQLAEVPKILETPKDSIKDDAQNMHYLLSLYNKRE